MRTPVFPPLTWGILLLVLAGGLGVWSGGAAALLLVAGAIPALGMAILLRARGEQTGPWRQQGASVPPVILALGVAAICVGLTAGVWLILVGAEITLFAAVALVREIRETGGPPA